jgi:hypothetical protein
VREAGSGAFRGQAWGITELAGRLGRQGTGDCIVGSGSLGGACGSTHWLALSAHCSYFSARAPPAHKEGPLGGAGGERMTVRFNQ